MKKTVDVVYEEGEGLEKYELKGTVTMKRLNFSEKNSIEEESTDIRMIGSVPQIKVSTTKIKELGIFKSVVGTDLTKTIYVEDKVSKQPIPINSAYNLDMTGIKELSQEVGEQLIELYTELNTISEKKK